MSPMEFYNTVKSQDFTVKWHEINKCSICLCEVYDDISVPEEEEKGHDPVKVYKMLMAKLVDHQKALKKNFETFG
jgi:hypothetical protein